MAAADTSSGADGGKAGGFSRLLTAISTQIIPVLVSAAGFAGLVAFVGGITMYARFYAAQVPPEQAVDAMPDPELIVVGAATMAVFGIAGALAVTTAYVLDKGGRQTKGMARTLVILAVIGGLVACIIADENGPQAWVACGLVVGAGLLVLAVFGLFGELTDDLPPTEDERTVQKEGRTSPAHTRENWRAVLRASQEHERERVAADRQAKEAARAAKSARDAANHRREERRGLNRLLMPPHVERPDKGRPMRFRLNSDGRFWVAFIGLASAVLVWRLLDDEWLGIAILLAFGLPWANYGVAAGTGATFAWFGVSIFFAVVLFGSYLAVADTVDDPKLQPAAVVRKGDWPDGGVLGVYITESDKRLYLATVSAGCGKDEVRDDSGRLFWVPKDDVRAMSIGRAQDVKDAAVAAPRMLQALIAANVPGPDPPDKDATGAGATSSGAVADGEAKPAGAEAGTVAAVNTKRRAAELDDEADPGDESSGATADVPPPYPAVVFTPEVQQIAMKDAPTAAAAPGQIAASPGDIAIVEGIDFGQAPRVIVDDVRARVTKYPKPQGESELEFRIPHKAESGRVEVRCGDSGPQEIRVRHRPVPVVHRRKAGRNRLTLSAEQSSDFDGRVTRYVWTLPRGRPEHGPTVTIDRPRSGSPVDLELQVTDNSGLRRALEIEVRLQGDRVRLDREIKASTQAQDRPELTGSREGDQ
ncbi:MAG TPA: hypothetical protein VFB51_12930 [Solirubrobacterales bacterium]|nr:hypothetical protein [Solirubrobacterales bacterium]